jgi:hypothetical protein
MGTRHTSCEYADRSSSLLLLQEASELLTVAALASLLESQRQSMEEISGALAALAAQVGTPPPASTRADMSNIT